MKTRKCLIAFLCTSLLLTASCRNKPEIFVKDVLQPIINLNGTWEICSLSYDELVNSNPGNISWKEIEVPGECMMQGFPIKHNEPFTYREKIRIPSYYKGKTVKIRFEGAYSYARVWVNGNFIRDHFGGFTAWECDITSSVKSGEYAILDVEITDRADEISYASGYAKHQIGGILRNVTLMALPANYPENVVISTDLDLKYTDATLDIEGTTIHSSEEGQVEAELYDGKNRRIRLESPASKVTGNKFKITNTIKDPAKWDAEHPNLYKLYLSYNESGEVLWKKMYEIGFRELEIKGNKMLVNGKQIRLKGVCRHDIHPLLGRMTTPEYDLKDVLLAKEANINFIRTSHYPPSEKFLEYCDKFGIYVEDETAVCFVGSHRTAEYYPGASENSPEFTGRYLSQLEEMVDNHRNHPSVVIWSIGNENTFGTNFKLSYDWIKENDPSRPVIYSYPGQVPDSIQSYDIISMHYPGITGTMNQYGTRTYRFGHNEKPVIFDEWAHVACYNNETVKEDPNVRDFWGISLDSMWQRTFDSDGGLGGAIWGMIDETFMLPADLPGYNEWWGKLDKNVIPGNFTGHTIGYGEWGIVDTWRRKKPEFWNVKKAYSPVRVLQMKNYTLTPGKPVEIPVYNRFDFTNLNEITLKCSSGNKTTIYKCPDIPPHTKGVITLKPDTWSIGKYLKIEFTDQQGTLIDACILSSKEEEKGVVNNIPGGKIDLEEDDNFHIIVCNNNLKIRIEKSTGLFKSYETSKGLMEFSGPFLNIRALGKEVIYSSHALNDICTKWIADSISVKKENNTVKVSLRGKYNNIFETVIETLVFPDGSFNTDYSVNNLPVGKLREAGIKFVFENVFDSLSWRRESYWSYYPSEHLSAREGIVPLYTGSNKIYRSYPEKDWHNDKRSFFYNGTENENSDGLINSARSTKENITEYILISRNKVSIKVNGNGKTSCRTEKTDEKIVLNISGDIDYPDLSWGNYIKNINIGPQYRGKVSLSILQNDATYSF